MFITILENETSELTEKKSKFIANVYYIESKIEAEEKINKLRKKYFDARHNCIAYRVMESEEIIERSSDDGEPSGTAGAPMLNILQKNNLCNVLVVVTRYFGGILLGTGGLVRCYSQATLQVIEKAKKAEIFNGIEYEIKLEYNQLENFKYYCKKNNINIENIEYLNQVICNIVMKEDFKEIFIKDVNEKKLNIIESKYLDKKMVKNELNEKS